MFFSIRLENKKAKTLLSDSSLNALEFFNIAPIVYIHAMGLCDILSPIGGCDSLMSFTHPKSSQDNTKKPINP